MEVELFLNFGVIIILQPGTAEFQNAMIYPVMAALGYSCLSILTRKVGSTDTASVMVFYINVFMLVISFLFGLFAGDGSLNMSSDPSMNFLLKKWETFAREDLSLYFAIGLSSLLGGFFISQAYKASDASFVAPFEYIAMPVAVVVGVILFSEWPSLMTWFGMLLIMFSGIFVFIWDSGRFRSIFDKKIDLAGLKIGKN